MKRKILYTFLLVAMLCLALAIVSSATTYYVDKDGGLVDSTSSSIAYEFDLSSSRITSIYLHDASITKIVIPNIESFTGTVQLQTDYLCSLEIYMLDDKEAKSNNLMAQIKEVVVYENIYLDGAYSTGVFAGYTSLEKLSFYGKIGVSGKGGFFNGCTSLKEINLYGQDLSVPAMLTCELGGKVHSKEFSLIFHEGSSGTWSTGGETLPYYATLGGWKIIINENIKPSNEADTRLGKQWGSVVSTTGWELIVAVSNKNNYTQEQLETLKTSHGFCSRFASVSSATVKEATVTTYCDLGYASHSEQASYEYTNGYASNGTQTTVCTKGCGLEKKTDLAPIITLLGYSAKENGDNICVGYSLNKEALALFEEKTSKTLDYGVVAIIPQNESEYTPLYVENGVVKAIDFSISASVASTYSSFDFVISGFSASDYSTALIMCAYVYDGEEIGYLCKSEDEQGESVFCQYEKALTITYSSLALA